MGGAYSTDHHETARCRAAPTSAGSSAGRPQGTWPSCLSWCTTTGITSIPGRFSAARS